jgi:hypothetical protein
MQTIVLSDQTSSMTVAGLIEKAAGSGVEVRDQNGAVVAYVLPPANHEAWLYAEARVFFEQHREEFAAAHARHGGITTAELIAKATTQAVSAETR